MLARCARLEVVAGPLKGATYELTEPEVSIGRETSNAISALDASVSRRHCLIRQEVERWKIIDLDSRNGTQVNGIPVQERILEDGDAIRIGDSLFLFLTGQGTAPAASNTLKIEDSGFVKDSTVALRRQDLRVYQGPADLLKSPEVARVLGDLNTLLTVSQTIGSKQGLESLQQQILELIFAAIPFERGAILLLGDTPAQLASMFGWDTFAKAPRAIQVSRAVIDRVLKEGVAVCSRIAPESAAICGAGQAIGGSLAVVAAPFEVFGATRGVIYLDSSSPQATFDQGTLRLLSAIGSIAGLALENARRLDALSAENRRLQTEMNAGQNMLGQSQRMRSVFEFIRKVGAADSTVLICGESGTGKELVARAIHQNSRRSTRPFIAINCAALAETLLESEVFGHEKGAFTGATSLKKGRFELADSGTVFLDEISEFAPPLQAKLLRVLQEREFERVGSARPIRVDVRVIAATNRDLKEAVAASAFRPDLFYRLDVVAITLPALRERKEDIPLLANHFVTKHRSKSRAGEMRISPEAMACLVAYDWPGNVRELENAIERAIVLGSTDIIVPEDLPESIVEKDPAASGSTYHQTLLQARRQLILSSLERTRGNYTEAARLLGVHPNYLHRLIRNLNLKEVIKASAIKG